MILGLGCGHRGQRSVFSAKLFAVIIMLSFEDTFVGLMDGIYQNQSAEKYH